MSKRITSLFLVMALCLTLLPTAALAVEQPEAVNSTAVQAASAEKTESSVASVVIDGTPSYYDTLREAIMAAGEKAGSDGTPPAITLLQDGVELRYPQYNSAEKRDDPTYPVIVDMGGNSLSSVYFQYGTLTLTGGTVSGTWGADLRSGGSLIMTAPEDAEAAVSGPLKITNISGQVGTAKVSGAKIGVKGTLYVENSAAGAVVISGSDKAVELSKEATLFGCRLYGSKEENGSPDTVAVYDADQKTYTVNGVTAKTLVSGPKAVVAVTPGDTLSVMAGEAQEYTAQFTAEGVVTGSVKGLGDLQATVENGDANGITVNVTENAADGTWKVTVQTAESTPLDTYTLNLSSAVDGAVSGSVQFKVSETKYAASVNGTNYRSLSAAIDAAKNVNGTVTLLDNVTGSVTVTEGNKFTIDLNGKTWTGASNSRALTVNGGEVTLSSTGGAGTIVGSDTTKYAVQVDSGTVHLKENVTLSDRIYIADQNGGSVTFEPGVTVTKNIMTDSRSVVRFLDGLALQNASKAYVPFHGVFTNEYPLGYVTVVAHPDHNMVDGVCDQCGYVCGHSNAKAGDTACPDCGAMFIADATAADGNVTRYTNADAALAAAAGSAKVTFVPGTYTLKNAVSFSGRIETEIDLNGATLQYASGDQGVVLLITESYENITITLKNGTVQNTGEGTGIGLYSNTKNSARSALTLENVTVIGGVDTFNMRQAAVCVAKNNTLTVKSGSFSGPLDLNLAESTVKLYVGTYQNGITGSMYRDGGWQYELSAEDYAALLDNSDPAKQYAYADGANGAVISYATVAERMNDRDDTNNSIRVVAHEHTMNDSACTQCGFVCTAHQYKNGVCAICHAECPHTDATCNAEIWTCDACGLTMAVKIQTDTNTRHFTSLKDALAAAENGQTVTLLDNIDQSNETACLTGDGKTVTLNLNGKNITGGWIDVGRDQDGTVINSSRLNITGSGSFDGMIGISAKGTLDLSGWDGGTIKTVDLSKSGDDECTLIVGEKAGTIQTLQIYNWPTDKSGDITYINNTELRGGSYNNIPITMKSEDGAARYIPYGSMLAPGYAFQYTDSGAFVDYAAKAVYSGDNNISNVKVVRCTSHVDANSDNHCDYCNTDLTTGVAATLETGGATYYYTDLPSALKAASSKGGTVTLQKDVENVSQMLVIEGSLHVTLDLNGKKITGNGSSTLLGISNLSDVTICDSSESKAGQIKCTASGYAVYVSEGCDLTISGGTFEGTDDATTSAPGYAVGVDGAKLIITGGTFNGAVTINARGATITGGTFNGAFSMSAQPDVFSGGTFTQQAVFSSVSNILTGGEFQKGIKSTDKKLYELLAENKAYQTAADWLDDITTYLCSDTGSSVTVAEAPIHSVTLTVNGNPVALEDNKGRFSVELGTDVTLTASCEGSMAAPYVTWSPSLGGEDGGTGNPVKQGTGKSLSYTLPSKDLTVGTHTYRVSFCSENPGSIGQVTGYYKVAQITITVTPRDLKNATVEYFTTNNPTVVTYNPLNNHICGLPIYEVTLDGVELKEGTDYIISGNTAAEVGKYTAILTEKSDSTKCKGTLKIEWEVVPYALPEPSFEGSQTYTKIYDGTTNLPKEYKFQALFLAKEPGSSEVDWREDEFKDNYEVTSAEFVSPDAGENKPINQTITLKNKNFVFKPTEKINVKGITTTDKTITYKNFTLSEAYPTLGTTFNIKKATVPDFDKEVTLGIINDLENTYTIDLPDLPALESPRTYGDTQYEVDQSSVKELTQGYNAIHDVGFAVNPDNGKTQLTFHAPAVKNQTEGSVGAIQITVTPTNYKPVTLIVNLQSVNKRKLGMFVSVATDPVVYGMTLGDIKLSAEATDGSQVIPGTIAWEDPLTTVPAAGQATYRWTFTPDDTMHYLTASNTIHFSVDKATPTGAPTYTAITAGGKTLADAALTANASWPSGTVQWVDKDGKVLDPATTEVKANTAYQWKFTPDSKNYDPIEGSITLYYVSTGGGGSTTYPVSTPSKTENGSVSVSPKNASRGDTVTITVKPNDGYVLDDLAVTDKNGNDLKLTDKGNGKYTFTMPAGKVEVKASFAEEAETSPFADVATDAYCYDAVKWAAEQGITGGIGNNLFGPNQSCTRAQIVTFLWRAAGSPEPKDMSSFSDVPADSYYAKAVAWAVENGITTGTGDGKFSPDATCTRAQAVTFLARALNAKATSAAEFSDVPTDSYFAEAVAWAASNGVTAGIGGGLFGPNNDCTRAQIVTFLFRAYNK